MRVDVKADPLNVEADALAVIIDAHATMPDYYARQLLAGQRPEGGAMPTNKQGKPLGLGSGTIATQWWTTTPTGDAHMAGFSTGPFQEGGHFYAVRALVERGSSPVSSEGRANTRIMAVVNRAADRAVRL